MDSDSEVAGGISHSGGRFGGVAVRAPPSITPSTGEEADAERCRGAAASAASSSPAASSFLTLVRTTTGGIGREPGMLIRTRVVSVVSVFGPSSSPGPEPWAAPAPARSPPGKPGVP
ncbi:hypothetical protein ACFQ0M_29395 [Kitasatospora aburaviensis]